MCNKYLYKALHTSTEVSCANQTKNQNNPMWEEKTVTVMEMEMIRRRHTQMQAVAVFKMNVQSFNSFMSKGFKEAISKSPEALKLGLVPSMLGAVFFKKLECQLNTILWDIYQDIKSNVDCIEIGTDVAGNKGKVKPDCLQCRLPVPENFLLPCISRLQPVASKGAIWCVKLFGVVSPQLADPNRMWVWPGWGLDGDHVYN